MRHRSEGQRKHELYLRQQEGWLVQAKKLLAAGVPLNTINSQGGLSCTALRKISLYQNEDLFMLLLQNGGKKIPDPSETSNPDSQESLTISKEIEYRKKAREKLSRDIIEIFKVTPLGPIDHKADLDIVMGYYGGIEDDQELIKIIGFPAKEYCAKLENDSSPLD